MMDDNLKNRYLLFEIDEEYAVELSKVLEVIEFQPVTRVPETPDYITGVINLRGHVVPVIDLRVRFKKALKEYNYRTCIIVVDIEGIHLGLVVDKVLDLITFNESEIIPPPQVGNDYSHVFIKSIGMHEGKVKLIIDGDKIINYNDLEFLNETESES